MKVLGLSGGFRQGYQDASVCLVENGKIVMALEEERFSRIKFSPGRLPFQAISRLLKETNCSLTEIDVLSFHGSTWGEVFEQSLKLYIENHFGFCPPIKRFHHHDCHAASTFFASGFEKALVYTIDSSGDGVSLQVSLGEGNTLRCLNRFERPLSLGIFYSLITQYCGFTKEQDEYKLMGLSSYGNRDAFDFSDVIYFENGALQIDTHYFVKMEKNQASPHKDDMLFTDHFIQKMGQGRRTPGEAFSVFYKDVAASAQAHLEKIMLSLSTFFSEKHQVFDVCLAGGAALNCVMNQKLMNASHISRLFVQPAAGDAGISFGSAWLAGLEEGIKPIIPANYYLGNQYDNADIETVLIQCGLPFTKMENTTEEAAELLAKGNVVAWFQGRMEFGPRALGNRSILANPCVAGMQDRVNQKIKFREAFRPFCPSVLEEDAHLFFDGNQFPAPFMNVTYTVKQEYRPILPAITHVDGTARIQTVNAHQNLKFYNLLNAFKQRTGYGVLLNTSFNVADEPIVQSPREAIATFYGSGLDYLLIGDFKVWKK